MSCNFHRCFPKNYSEKFQNYSDSRTRVFKNIEQSDGESITHELKSPIAGIRLALETIAKRGDQLPVDKRRQLSQRGIKEADRLNKLVEDLLLSARLESAYQFQQEPLDLADLTERIVSRMQLQRPDAKIDVHIDPDLPHIQGDSQALSSVLINLVENALKYSGGQPEVNVKVHKAPSKEVVLEVEDHGIGISSVDKERIFEKFYRVGSEDTRRTKGTGLGLFIVKELVLAHQGQISVSDNKPQGTVFTVTLPALAA